MRRRSRLLAGDFVVRLWRGPGVQHSAADSGAKGTPRDGLSGPLQGEVTREGAPPGRQLLPAVYSQRKTFDDSAVQIANTTTSAATSPMCADHASPLKIPSSSDTA